MSEDPAPIAPSTPAWFRPWWFLAGLLVGLAVLSALGWRAGHRDFHPNFARIYPAISPETNYLPTLDELLSIVRHKCRRDQVLVLVGGNSILAGVWQPVPDLWSGHLQELLGDRYCVVNFAFRGGSPTDGAAVVAEVLRKEYPRQILIADEAPFSGMDSFGHDPYRYLFWQAYFRGWLMDSPGREARLAAYKHPGEQHRAFNEARFGVWLDRALNFRDLWNYVAFEYACTVPSRYGDCLPAMLTPRRTFVDDEPDAYNPVFMARKYSPEVQQAEMDIVRAFTGTIYVATPDGSWRIRPQDWKVLADLYADAFPVSLRARTILLLSRNSPYYLRLLNPSELRREDLGYAASLRLWRWLGFPAMEYGRSYGDNDYGDRTHLSKSGGRRLAEDVAPQVRAVATKLHYLP